MSNFVLFMLGTDTVRTPYPSMINNKPTPFYERGETLSWLSQLVKPGDEDLGVYPTDDVTAFSNDMTQVINGPTTLGYEVGDRIARGVLGLLHAISRGQTELSVIAHSRGAVESILIAHEIQAFLEAAKESAPLTADKLKSILLATPDTHYTRPAFQSLLKKDVINEELLRGLNTYFADQENAQPQIPAVELSLKLIDPVPGDGLRGQDMFAWRDQSGRFYSLPEVVKNCELMVCAHERSRFFYPVIPYAQNSETTQISVITIPGHHGTASGNVYDQQVRSEYKTESTGLVQDLVVCKFLQFLQEKGIELDPSRLEVDSHLKQQFVQQNSDGALVIRPDLEAFLSSTYQAIFDNIADYERYQRTNYKGIGRPSSTKRYVHFHSAANDLLSEVLPRYDFLGENNERSGYVNAEHLKLALIEIFGESMGQVDKTDPLALIERLRDILLKSYVAMATHQFDEDQTVDAIALALLSDSVRARDDFNIGDDAEAVSKMISVIISDSGQRSGLDMLAFVMQMIVDSYLQNHLTGEQKQAILDSLSKLFTDISRTESYLEKQAPDVQGELASLDALRQALTEKLDEIVKTNTSKLKHNFAMVEKARDQFETLTYESDETIVAAFDRVFAKLFYHALKHDLLNDELIAELKHAKAEIKKSISAEKGSDVSEKLALSLVYMHTAFESFQEKCRGQSLDKKDIDILTQDVIVNIPNSSEFLQDFFEQYMGIKTPSELLLEYASLYQTYMLGIESLEALIDTVKDDLPVTVSDHLRTLQQQRIAILEDAASLIRSTQTELPIVAEDAAVTTFYDHLRLYMGSAAATSAQQQQQIDEQQQQLQDKDQLIDDLQKQLALQANELEQLQEELDDLTRADSDWTSVDDQWVDSAQVLYEQEKDELRQELDAVLANYNDPETGQYLVAIGKLNNLCEAYQRHLRHELHAIDNTIDEMDLGQAIPENDDANYTALKAKYDSVTDLRNTLNTTEENDPAIEGGIRHITPKERLQRGQAQLQEFQEAFSSHRHKATRNFVIAMAAIFSLIPGLGVGVAALTSKLKSGHGAFWRSQGSQFFKNCNKELKNSLNEAADRPQVAPNA